MKKLLAAAVAVSALAINASAWFDGGLGYVTGPDGYTKTDAYLTVGSGSMWIKPALMRQTSDDLENTLNTLSARVGFESDLYTLAGEAGMTPATEINAAGSEYSNMFFGGDITLSLTPSSGGKGRLAGPNSKVASGGGQGVTRVDVGAGLKHTLHKTETGAVENETGQTEVSVFAGAKVLMARVGASWTGYKYGDEDSATIVNPINGHTFSFLSATPKSSVNVRVDLPGYPMVTPFASYTGTKYKGGADDSSAYAFGAYVDLNMIGANVAYQIFDDGSEKDNFVSVSAGLKF